MTDETVRLGRCGTLTEIHTWHSAVRGKRARR